MPMKILMGFQPLRLVHGLREGGSLSCITRFQKIYCKDDFVGYIRIDSNLFAELLLRETPRITKNLIIYNYKI